MTKLKTFKLQADNINGVYVVSNFEANVLPQDLFYSMLANNADDSVLCSEVNEEIFKLISDEYGIN